MDKLLRTCYMESGIKGANAVVFQKRRDAIRTLIDEDILEQKEWKDLTEWVLGIKNSKIENVLIKLEESFCKEDEKFSIGNVKELQILVPALIYQYSKENRILRFSLMIICGCHAGYMLLSQSLYLLFVQYVDEMRLAIRHTEKVDKRNSNLGAAKFKAAIEGAKKKEGEDFSYDVDQFDGIVNMLCQCELFLQNQTKREQYLMNELKVQKEESNMAWWLLNEWSSSYERSFSELLLEEAVLAIPIELWNLNEFAIGAYTVKQLIIKGISFLKKQSDFVSLDSIVKVARENIYQLINIADIQPEHTQPVLMALKCAYDCGNNSDEKAWKAIFEAKCQRKVEEIQMSAKEMACQLYLELELANLEE